MHKIKQLIIFAGLLGILSMLFLVNSCVTTPPKELTPEQRQAIQDSVMQAKKDSLNLLWSLGYEHYKQKSYENAKKYFRKIAFMDFMGLKDRRLQKVYQYLGTCYMHQETADPDSAEWSYIRGIEQLPDYPYNYEMLAYIYKTRGETEKAIEMYTTLTGLIPDTSLYWVELGKLLVLENNCDDGITALREGVAREPDNSDILQTLSESMKDCGVDTEEIIQSLEALVNQEPDNIQHRIDLARNYMDIFEFRKASVHLETASALEPENLTVLELVGKCYQEIGQYSKAVDAYNKILTIQPKNLGALCNMAIAYSSKSQYTAALSQVNKANAINPDYGYVYITRGIIFETAADKCTEAKDGKIEFSDKLAYELAYKEYVRATKDISTKSEANRRIGYVKPLLPTRADIFMNKGQIRPEGSCYEWIP
ncbi:tetratricopeptide repeat protein [bacterium]|nr:tetratricopeptide repeat protein [bacterium]